MDINNGNFTKVEPQSNNLRYNDLPSIMINNHLPSKSYSKKYGQNPGDNDLRYNDIPGLTMGMSLSKCKIFPVILIKSISLITKKR